jgi:hypothetical protein
MAAYTFLYILPEEMSKPSPTMTDTGERMNERNLSGSTLCGYTGMPNPKRSTFSND